MDPDCVDVFSIGNGDIPAIESMFFLLPVGVSKNMGKPPNHPFVHRVFHYFHHPFWGKTPGFLETSMLVYQRLSSFRFIR